MVDALRRAREWVTADGCVIDIHPTEVPAWLEIGGEPLGPLDAGDALARHARATAAVTAAVGEGLFEMTAARDFTFATNGDSIEELADFIAAHWRSTRIGSDLADAARARLRAPAAARLRVVEAVNVTRLRPTG